MSHATAILEAEDLAKEFGGFYAVDGVDLSIREGEIHGLIGPNGAGKTTTFNLLTGELPVTRGSIRFRGDEITELSPVEITRRGIGRSFQIVQYFPDETVREHLRLAVRDPTRTLLSFFDDEAAYTDQIESIAGRVQLADRLDVVAKNLSHGERRYLDIGMVLGLEPDLILFDEPAAGLNPSEAAVLEDIVEELKGEYTILLVEHDVDLVHRLADRMTVLHRGEVLVSGTPDEITTHSKVKEVYLGE